MTTPGPNPLLCESCGYALTGLPLDAACPECGTPVGESLPSRRPGSAWQRGLRRGWITTTLAFLNRPRAEFRLVSIEPRRSQALLLRSTFIAAVLASTPWVMLVAMYGMESSGPSVPSALATGVIGVSLFVVATWCVLMLASWIETVGIRFFGRRRGWRITRDVAAAVCAHAAVGWVAGGAFGAVAACMAALAGVVEYRSHLIGPVAIVYATIGLSLGAIIGLLWFEILVYMGVRACRFANPPDATGALPDGRGSQPLGVASVSSSDVGAGAPATNAYDASTRLGEPSGTPTTPPLPRPGRRAAGRRARTPRRHKPGSLSTPP